MLHHASGILQKRSSPKKVRKKHLVCCQPGIVYNLVYVVCKSKVKCLYIAVSKAVYALLVDLFNRTPFYIILKIQPVTVTRYVHAMLLTWCFSHLQLAGGEQGRHRPDWHFDGER